jgi:NADPH-dependent 2,4-dienoyl-CoA reductase/sulfur reductase-like enzyme
MLSRKLLRSFSSSIVRHNKVVIIGAGAGGVTLAGKLATGGKGVTSSQITLIDGSPLYHYKPGWTLFTDDNLPKNRICRDIREVIPEGANFVNQYVETIDPSQNMIHLKDGSKHTYEHLVVSTGLQFNWDKVKGLREALEDPNRNVCSVYHYPTLEKMKRIRQNKYSDAVFTQASGHVSCAGAAQKVLYLAHDSWSKKGFHPNMQFIQGGSVLFGVKFYAQKLEEIVENKNIKNVRGCDLVEVLPDNTAIFINNQTKETFKVNFDFLHSVPFMSGPDFLRETKLADKDNLVMVDKHTLQHVKYPNVWSLGDSSNLPTGKTFSAVLEQAHILSNNLISAMKNQPFAHKYYGYTCCPLVVGNGKCILAEFKYDSVINPTFFDDQRTPTSFGYLLKKHVFPFAALHLLHNGIWKGRRTLFTPPDKDLLNYQRAEEARIEKLRAPVIIA